MSGPWDRPSSGEAGDEWPSEDLHGPGEAWTPDAPRDSTPAASSGWDDWPPPAPPPDDYLTDEPSLPTTDLWSESWADEAAELAPVWSPEPEPQPERGQPVEPPTWSPEPEPEPEPERVSEPSWSPPSPEPQPAPTWTPEPEAPVPSQEPEPRAWSPEPEGATSAEPAASQPPAEPWAFDADPWAVPPIADIGIDEITEAPWYAPEAEPEPPPADIAPELPPTEAAAEPPVPETPAPVGEDHRPSLPEAFTPAEAPSPEAFTPAEAATAQPIDLAAPVEPIVVDAEPEVPEREPEPEAEPPAAPDETVPEPSRRRKPWWASGPASWLGEPEPDAEPEPPVEAAMPEVAAPEVPAAQPEPEPPVEAAPEVAAPEVPAAQPEPEPPVEAAPDEAPSSEAPAVAPSGLPPIESPSLEAGESVEPGDTSEVAEAAAELTGAELEVSSEAAEPGVEEVTAGAEEADAAPGPEPAEEPPGVSRWRSRWFGQPAATPEVESAAATPAFGVAESEPDAEVITADEAEPEPAADIEAEPMPPEPAWPDQLDGTQVFPSSWTPAPRAEPKALEPEAGPVRTTFAERVNAEELEEAAPTTAEQAVPWLIGVILLLAGLVIVLLALIFAGDASLGGAAGPSNSQVAVVTTDSPASSPSATPIPTVAPTPGPSQSVAPTPTPLAVPEYGPLEMVYLGRSAPLAHIFLLRHDFTLEQEPVVLAQDPDLDVRRFSWSPDGRFGAGLYADLLISVEPGVAKRRMADGISTLTFGADPAVIYAVRVTQDGTNDVATILAFDFASGESSELASVTYPRPQTGAETALLEAQFVDEGGPIRLFWMEDRTLHLWVLGAGAWTVDPATAVAEPIESDALPTLWSPRGNRRIAVTSTDTATTVELVGREGETLATTTAAGLVSHLRWSRDGDRVVFTLARSASGGGILQDLFLWDLGDGQAPTQLTSTGAAFSAEWMGTTPLWREQEAS